MPQLDLSGEEAKAPPAPIFTSKSDEWGTPQRFFDELDREFDFTLDPCANKSRPLKPGILCYDIKDNGLEQDWTGQRVFINPPYSGKNITLWFEKAHKEKERPDLIVLLVPLNKGSTSYFHDHINPFADIRFIRGRLKFFPLMGQDPNGNPMGSMLCILRKHEEKG